MSRIPPPFEPPPPDQEPEARIVSALERLSQAFRVLLWDRAQPGGLSPVQIRILLHLERRGPSLRSVTGLAREFDLTAATVSDAVSALVSKGLVARTRSERDRRVSILDLTCEGRETARGLRGWTDVVRRHVEDLPGEEKAATLRALLSLVAGLHEDGVITVARMCVTCRFFERRGGTEEAPHRCRLLGAPLRDRDLRVDCPEHEPAPEATG